MNSERQTLLNEIIELNSSIVDDMPPRVREAFDKIVNTLAKDLGESPEAWRGAVEMARHVMMCVVADRAEQNATTHLLMVFIAGFTALPWAVRAAEGIIAEDGS